MIESMFQKSRLLVFLTILISLISAIILYLASINIMFHIVYGFFISPTIKPSDGQILAVNLLKTLDILFIALTFQMIAIANYRLFIANKSPQESRFLSVLGINDFHDLKINLLQVSIIILVILFLEQAVEMGANLETFLYGSSIAMIIATIVLAIKALRH